MSNTITDKSHIDNPFGPAHPLWTECRILAERAAEAARLVSVTSGAARNAWLKMSAESLRLRKDEILAANQHDVDAAPGYGLNSPAIDRLRLDSNRLEAIAKAVEEVAALPDPVGEVIHGGKRPNGLEVSQIRVPLGVVFMIYESRPNVTIDAAALCVKSGNACILRGGKEATHTNRIFHQVLSDALEQSGFPRDAVGIVPTSDRDAVGLLLQMDDLIDLAIPRGGPGLIKRVSHDARMPVLKHDAGICHVYIDKSADFTMGVNIIVNSKAQRPAVCNAAETMLVHHEIAPNFLPIAAEALMAAGVELRGDEQACQLVPLMVQASPQDWDTEYGERILNVAVVADIDAALTHILRHSSKHTEAIITKDIMAAQRFIAHVDSSAVMVNASTRFNDGGELGLGAEIGISTSKFHARGPCGLTDLTTTKWIVIGQGQTRS
ncbi:MAG: glutamate-5-semialdehyde dehydrogenase [Planctomycetota bacterium]|nr:glutamate-5-semialdehyde dehydrogenase [Planctomycetota bacterium]